jgi:hypothetical protein
LLESAAERCAENRNDAKKERTEGFILTSQSMKNSTQRMAETKRRAVRTLQTVDTVRSTALLHTRYQVALRFRTPRREPRVRRTLQEPCTCRGAGHLKRNGSLAGSLRHLRVICVESLDAINHQTGARGRVGAAWI